MIGPLRSMVGLTRWAIKAHLGTLNQLDDLWFEWFEGELCRWDQRKEGP